MDIVNDQNLMLADVVRSDCRRSYRSHLEGQVCRRGVRLTQVQALLGLTRINNEDLQFFAALDDKQEIVVNLQRIVCLDTDAALQEAQRQVEPRKLCNDR